MVDEGFREMYGVLADAERAVSSADVLLGQVEDGERDVRLAVAAGVIACARALVALNYRIGYESTLSRRG